MTQDDQNKDYHWVNHMKVTNRVSGNNLNDDKPILSNLADLDNSKVIPSLADHTFQKQDYIFMIKRILVNEVPYLEFCKEIGRAHV